MNRIVLLFIISLLSVASFGQDLTYPSFENIDAKDKEEIIDIIVKANENDTGLVKLDAVLNLYHYALDRKVLENHMSSLINTYNSDLNKRDKVFYSTYARLELKLSEELSVNSEFDSLINNLVETKDYWWGGYFLSRLLDNLQIETNLTIEQSKSLCEKSNHLFAKDSSYYWIIENNFTHSYNLMQSEMFFEAIKILKSSLILFDDYEDEEQLRIINNEIGNLYFRLGYLDLSKKHFSGNPNPNTIESRFVISSSQGNDEWEVQLMQDDSVKFYKKLIGNEIEFFATNLDSSRLIISKYGFIPKVFLFNTQGMKKYHLRSSFAIDLDFQKNTLDSSFNSLLSALPNAKFYWNDVKRMFVTDKEYVSTVKKQNKRIINEYSKQKIRDQKINDLKRCMLFILYDYLY